VVFDLTLVVVTITMDMTLAAVVGISLASANNSVVGEEVRNCFLKKEAM
jgi:hypothetical protein